MDAVSRAADASIDDPPESKARRIVVLGPPGSGKSTLARALGARDGLPVFHLDRAYWRPGWIAAEPDAFLAEVERLCALPDWVIEGNYTATIAPRLATADALVYLDAPAWLSVARVLRRTLATLGRSRPDMPAGCPEQFTPEFLRFTATWNRLRRDRTLALLERFGGRTHVLDARASTPRHLEML